MATLKGGSFGSTDQIGVDQTAWDLTPLQTGQITAMSTDSVTIDVGDHHYVLTGHHFAYLVSNGEVSLAAGKITGIDYYPNLHDGPDAVFPVPLYTIGDIKLDVGDFNDFVAHNNVAGYERALFSGNDHMEGSASQDHLLGLRGNDLLNGFAADDTLEGGRGSDVLIGGAGADWLRGGAGPDLFVYHSASESGGGVYDTLDGFNVARDRLVVPHEITGIDPSVDAGTSESFNVDPNLEAALDADHLGAHHAAIATVVVDVGVDPPAYQETFLVIDVNGDAGYQAGEDLAIKLLFPRHLDQVSVDDFISPSTSG